MVNWIDTKTTRVKLDTFRDLLHTDLKRGNIFIINTKNALSFTGQALYQELPIRFERTTPSLPCLYISFNEL